jgi:hypothetical protein
MQNDRLILASKKMLFIYKSASNGLEDRACKQVWDTLKINKQVFGSVQVKVVLHGWGSSHHIHSWFVNNVQGGVDDDRYHEVTREQLQQFVDVCKKALANKKKAGHYFPTNEAYRSECPTIDDGYFHDLENDVKRITRILKSPKYKDWDFGYSG